MNKGSYYVTKTIAFYRAQGYHVEKLEKLLRIVTKDKRVVFIKRDLFGCDVLAINEEEVIFIQVKSNRGHIAAGLKELAAYPCPNNETVKQVVVFWEPRAREPEVIPVERE